MRKIFILFAFLAMFIGISAQEFKLDSLIEYDQDSIFTHKTMYNYDGTVLVSFDDYYLDEDGVNFEYYCTTYRTYGENYVADTAICVDSAAYATTMYYNEFDSLYLTIESDYTETKGWVVNRFDSVFFDNNNMKDYERIYDLMGGEMQLMFEHDYTYTEGVLEQEVSYSVVGGTKYNSYKYEYAYETDSVQGFNYVYITSYNWNGEEWYVNINNIECYDLDGNILWYGYYYEQPTAPKRVATDEIEFDGKSTYEYDENGNLVSYVSFYGNGEMSNGIIYYWSAIMTGFNDVKSADNRKVTKFIEDGKFCIMVNGKVYNAQGQQVR